MFTHTHMFRAHVGIFFCDQRAVHCVSIIEKQWDQSARASACSSTGKRRYLSWYVRSMASSTQVDAPVVGK